MCAAAVLRRSAAGAAARGALFAILWYILAEGSLYNVPLAAIVVLGATGCSLYLAPPEDRWRVAVPALVLFCGWFLLRATIAGADVARRAFHPSLSLQPDLVEIQTGLPAGAPRVMFAAVLSLLPGTLSVRMQGDLLLVHLLDHRMDLPREARSLERRVGAVFRAHQDKP